MAGSQSDGVSLPTLILTGGPLDGTEFPLRMSSREMSIGSSGGSDIQIALGNVDPLHAQLTFSPGGLSIADIGSATGTFLNGERVEDDTPLQDGDRICLGPPGAKESAKLLVRLPGGAAAATPEEPPAAASEGPAFGDAEPGPVLLGGDDAPMSLADEAPWPPPEASPPEPSPPAPAWAPPPAPAQEEEEKPPFLPAEDVVVDGFAAGPPLGADEVPEEDPLFSTPLPPTVSPPSPPPPSPAPPSPPAPPPEPAPPPALVPPPPPPPTKEEPPAAPLLEEPPPPEIPRLIEQPPPAPRPSPHRPAASASRGRRPARRARRTSLPLVPIAGAALLVLALGAGGWWFYLRPAPAPAPAPAPRATPRPATPSAKPTAAPTAAPVESPQAPHLEPEVALPGQTIEIRGQLPTGPVSVTIGGQTAAVGETTAESIHAVVPGLALPSGQKVQVVATIGSKTLPPLDLILGQLPLILEMKPASGSPGDQVIVAGRGFDPRPTANTVTFGGAPALVLSASPTELTVAVPAPKVRGLPQVPVVVSTGGRASAGDRNFSMARSTASSFVPRFFAAPVTEHPGEDLAFVSTELGPVLLLAGTPGGPSAAARAVEISTQLNQLVARARSRRVDLELRGRPEAVAVVGETSTLAAATPADAAAYARGWEGAERAPRLAPAAVTRYWAAILEDYFDLFLYRERPLEVASLDPRHRVFLDIYAEATRRGSSPGVPASIVLPPSEAMGAALRRAALVLRGGPGREEIAVEGRWRGTLEDPTTGSRRFELSFRPEGEGLDGAIKTWRGSLELTSPLRDVSFRSGTLRFTTDLQGTAHHFEGTLHDTTITGTATREGRPPVPFSVDLVE